MRVCRYRLYRWDLSLLGDCAVAGAVADSWTRWLRRQPVLIRQVPGPPGLGDRLRQLRVSAGLTQTDLAGDRFSKEYISQIERGKTRPTARDGRVARRPARRRRDVPRQRRLDRRARARRGDPRARRGAGREARVRRRRSTSTRDALAAVVAHRAPSSSRFGCSRARRGHATHRGEVRAGDRAARRRHARSSRARSSPTSTAPRSSSASASAATCSRASRPPSRCSARRSRCVERSPLPVRPAPREHPHVALALLPPPARLRGRARGRRARARARRVDGRTRARSARRTSRPR